jgi:hypothetical protein
MWITDNPINQTILSTWMKKRQIKYDVAMNGLEAVQKWKSGEFHLILVRPPSNPTPSGLINVPARWTFKCPLWMALKQPKRSEGWRN